MTGKDKQRREAESFARHTAWELFAIWRPANEKWHRREKLTKDERAILAKHKRIRKSRKDVPDPGSTYVYDDVLDKVAYDENGTPYYKAKPFTDISPDWLDTETGHGRLERELEETE